MVGTPIEIRDFVAGLPENNQYKGTLATTLERTYGPTRVLIRRRGPDLPEVVRDLVDQNRHPIVDKGLRVVFGADSHGLLLCQLFRYRYYAENWDRPHVDTSESADRFVADGLGYFIQSIRSRVIVVGTTYRPDRYDRLLFAGYQLDHQRLDGLKEIYRLQGLR